MDWTHAAEELGRLIPRKLLHPRVLSRAESVVCSRATWLVGFSGGADSLCLLLLLWAHWPGHRGRLVAAHFNHRLRGRESLGDAAFCRRVCKGLGIRLEEGAWTDKPATVSEATAREARQAFFQRLLRRRKTKVLWTGHQLDDIAETMLMRLTRGSGSAGLSAPRPVQESPEGILLLRPLAGLSKQDVSRFLIRTGVTWREDSSNAKGIYFRNRVRSEVIPVWCASAQGRDALAGAALSRELLEEDEEALQAWLRELNVLQEGPCMPLRPLLDKPRALVRRALHQWLAATPYRGDLSRQGFEQLLEACLSAGSTRFSLGKEGFALIRKKVLSFEPLLRD